MSKNHSAQIQSPIWVDIPTVCKMLSLSRSVIYDLVKAGHISPIKIGRSVRFRRSEIEAFASSTSNIAA